MAKANAASGSPITLIDLSSPSDDISLDPNSIARISVATVGIVFVTYFISALKPLVPVDLLSLINIKSYVKDV